MLNLPANSLTARGKLFPAPQRFQLNRLPVPNKRPKNYGKLLKKSPTPTNVPPTRNSRLPISGAYSLT
nr:MAG TPA: hypothetical protein [Caudoviricetes sp.]